MSKTTITLLIILILFLGLLLFVLYGIKQNPIITSITKPLISRLKPAHADLSLSTNEQLVKAGQTITVAVSIHDPNPNPNVVQLELGYDPTAVTIDTITPGTFFMNPVVALETIDPVAGRISYALRCPNSQDANTPSDCVNSSSSTLTTITLSINPYAIQNRTTLSFFPKTVVRTSTGRDLSIKTNGLQLTITKPFFPVSSSSAIINQPANGLIHITPIH